MLFKRKLYEQMLDWKTKRHGKSALLIKGARRVGKSTLVEHFAKQEYKSYVVIDFSRSSKLVDELFDDLSDLDFFFLRLQNLFDVQLYHNESVIIFDEVQFKPTARQAIKHLVADGRYDYIETGSLISIRKNVKDILIPSEETAMTLHPMDFEEFYWACHDNATFDLFRQMFEAHRPLGQSTHRKWMRELRLYMLVGGMPQAVDAYLQHNNLQQVDEIKRDILVLYDNDFLKIDPTGQISKLFMSIPSQLYNKSAHFSTSILAPGKTPQRVALQISDLEDSQTILLAHHVNDPNVGMELSKDLYRYKIYLADTGLFVTLAFKDKLYTDNVIYQKLLSDKLEANLGYIYENLVAQMLTASGNRLYYHTFPTGKGNNNYEVDFMLSRGHKVCPIEVKSSGYRTHKSLDVFRERFPSRISNSYLLYTKDYSKEGSVTCLPVYFTGLL